MALLSLTEHSDGNAAPGKPGRRVVGAMPYPLCLLISLMSWGTTWKRSPTMP